MDNTAALQRILEKDFEIRGALSEAGLLDTLTAAFAYLVENDLPKMMNILYRADVNEEKLKALLAEQGERSPAEIIAGAYLDRQKEKVETWKKYSR
ncbi:hypothetical protein [Pedobacter nutrimenti]|jgi:hypothetical protein|uniref:Uncharacterized protein n=1 Tax=Pedobacter nutrimenti TaxID=1241337 RepID=A0A318UMG9_9SPHI|nr:hypothetical protein [Pedobacter nutrimenti]PYF76607.1 hypothetical protein B0O44_10178 [Pedobacter nutrimenti]